MKKIVLTIVISMIMGLPIYAVMAMNNVVCAFNGDDTVKNSMESKMVDASSLFFQSHIEALNLINEVELSSKMGFDFNGALEYTNKAIKLLESARLKYTEVLETGKNLGYNELKRSMFTSFDYESFISTYNLNPVVAKRVHAYLAVFDVIGAHNQNIDNLSSCLSTLYSIKANLAVNKLENGLYWELISKYSDTLLLQPIIVQKRP